MNITGFLLTHRRMVLTLALISSMMGIWAWFNMPRQEDPQMRDYWANILVTYPGSDASSIERLVVDPLEESLAEVEEILHFDTTLQAEYSITHIELRNEIPDVEDAWDKIRVAIGKARKEFPEGVWLPELRTDLNDQESIVLALTGSDLLSMRQKAKDLRKQLLHLDEVVGVKLIADPGEQITILYNDSDVSQTGLSPFELARRIMGTNTKTPGGKLVVSGKIINLQPQTEFTSLDEIEQTPITLNSGATLPLHQIAQVQYGPENPTKNIMRYEGMPAIGLGIVPRDGIHLLDFGHAVRSLVEANQDPVIAIHELTYQPDRVQQRLKDLGVSLIMGILIVAGILLVFMGLRLGLVVSSVVPLVAFSSLGIFAAFGGDLHQISIAALVIALGMLVDNAIVIAENIQMRIDRGEPAGQAAVGAVNELAAPLASATGTTLAAFVPMLLAKGTTAEFTKDLPIVIMLTLMVSYFFAVAVTPALSQMFLKVHAKGKKSVFSGISILLARISTSKPWLVLILIGIFVVFSVSLAPMLNRQFFPSSDRNQFIVELKLPEGTHLDVTEAMTGKLERKLATLSEINSYASFIGRSAPHFYYNISQIPWRPHFAQILVTTQKRDQVDPLIDELREFARLNLPEVNLMPRKLEQGPPVQAPVEMRLYGNDLQELATSAGTLLRTLRSIPGVRDARQEMSQGAPTVHFKIQEAKAAQFGLSRLAIARAMFGQSHGIPAGTYRAEDDPVPILIRPGTGEHFPASQLDSMLVTAPDGSRIPLAQLATQSVEWEPASMTHRNGSRMTKVISQLAPETTFSEVQKELLKRLEHVTFPPGVHFEFGGQAEGSSKANNSIINALPWGAFLLFGILLMEFNSFRRVIIILVTVPLAATGVIPGLLIGGHPFGFMSFLGVIALIGVVVNNAIVLVDLIDSLRLSGTSMIEAIHLSVEQRTRPIMLTTLTTVAGLLPLAIAPSSLWPPLAWSMISGLLASTLLTLVAIPSLYYLIFRHSETFLMNRKVLSNPETMEN
jgi:multidrug efflux pump subunit AcrB